MAVGWLHYECVVVERHRQGILQGAVAAADGAPAEIVKQHARTGKRFVRWVAATVAINADNLPELPAALQFSDAVLEESEINSQSPVPYDRGKYLYIFWGTYTYAMRLARGADSNFPIASLPQSISQLGDAQAIFPAAKFRRFLDTGQFNTGARGNPAGP